MNYYLPTTIRVWAGINDLLYEGSCFAMPKIPLFKMYLVPKFFIETHYPKLTLGYRTTSKTEMEKLRQAYDTEIEDMGDYIVENGEVISLIQPRSDVNKN